jgi:uncharacterized protein YbaR (Trm112 family)
MRRSTIALLACPACHGSLRGPGGQGELLQGELRCDACDTGYAVHDGVPVFVGEAPDAWRDASALLDAALNEDPPTQQRLLETALTELNGADLVFRGMVLEARGDLDGAAAAFAASEQQLTGADARACQQTLLDACVQRTADASCVVDIASGRGRLVEELARAGRQVLATDISPVAMIRLRARLLGLGLDRVDCIACDIAALPFADGAVPVATTYVGVQNVPAPQAGIAEVRRVAAALLSVGLAYPPDDAVNGDALRENGYAHVADRAVLDALLVEAGWRTTYPLMCSAAASPTPAGEVIRGLGIDAFPVARTTLEWYLLEAA